MDQFHTVSDELVILGIRLVEPVYVCFIQPSTGFKVILNLARNAIEAMGDTPEGDRVMTITTRPGGGNAVIVTIKDTGPGISSAVRESVFNPFVTTKASGMGLGLSISQGIIDSHKGKLYLDDEPDQGAVFRFMLPVAQEN